VADSITTTATLRAEGLEYDDEIDRLLDAEEFDNEPLKPHKGGWSQVKRDLLRRRPELEESDLNDPTELMYVTHLCVLARLYDLSEIDDDGKKSQSYWARYRKEMKEVKLNDGVSQASETLMVRG